MNETSKRRSLREMSSNTTGDESVRKEEREDARNHLWSVVDKILVQLELMEGDVDDDIVEKLKRLKRLYNRSKRRDVRIESFFTFHNLHLTPFYLNSDHTIFNPNHDSYSGTTVPA